jgi:SPX domain protein involved in polyphosphate accumulation
MEKHLIDKYRYERKYILQKNQLYDLISHLYTSNYQKVFDERIINNIYFDTKDFKAVTENIDGLSNREKIRVRWYGKPFDSSRKTLEIKIKNEFLNRKSNFDIGIHQLKDFSSIIEFKTILKLKKSKFQSLYYSKLSSLEPTLFNSYKRNYFLNPINQTRITIDKDLYFFSPMTNVKYSEKYCIVEAKFEKKKHFINNFNNLILTRYSKYAKGTMQTNFYCPNY